MSFFAERRRWLIIALLMAFGAVNYIDRQSLSVLAPMLRRELGFSTEQYSYVVSAFLLAYTLGYAFSGHLLDRIGVKLGLAVALGFWSLAGAAHAAAFGWITLLACRVLLGLGQSFHGPGVIKAVGEWTPQGERALGSALVSNSNMIGAVLAAPLVSAIALTLGWRWAFLATGGLGFCLLALWWRSYAPPGTHPRLSDRERAKILAERKLPSGAGAGAPGDTSWAMFRDRRCLGFFFARMLTDPVSYFLAFWLPDYFQTVRGFSLATMAIIGWVPYLASPLLGGPVGGSLSDWLVRRGVPGPAARTRVMLGAACLMPLALAAVRAEHTWLAVALIAGLVAFHSCWTVNLLALASEVAPRGKVAGLVALSGMGGGLGGILSTLWAGRLIGTVGYGPVFSALGFVNLGAYAVLVVMGRNWRIRPALIADVAPRG